VAAFHERVTWVGLAVNPRDVGALGALPTVVSSRTVEAELVPTALMVEALKQYLRPGCKLVTL
jgi:hypothetical protein